ncbi:DUF6493 family protein [Streptomyces sp. WMMC500]|uniref:DUF7824 domain-containing protein n=1 Tax=Streptomyces sp. WMMC500 TaxID=3015154 RepID=UPI00248C30AF|nr:DUF6493 family protein [Streptomyces sp. WMMC500]WBB62094.1 DUF6493 family protein [Streptomyces sp. WMMC500]
MSDHPLFTLIDSGDYLAVPDALAAMTADERRAAVPELKAARASLSRISLWTYDEPRRIAVQLAGAGCLESVPAVAEWLLKGKTRVASIPGWRPDEALVACLFADGPGTRDTDFQAELVRRIADGRLDEGTLPYYRLAVELIRRSGCPVPVTDAFVLTWARKAASRYNLDTTPPTWDERPLAVILGEDRFLQHLTHRLFEIDGVPGYANSGPYERDDPDYSWPAALAALAADGTLDAGRLHDAVLASLVRGTGAAVDVRFRLWTLEKLAPSAEECAPYTDDYVRLLLDGPSTVAAHAQQVLRGILAPAAVVDVSRDALLRPEKKLVRAQLAWLDQVVRREPATAGAVVEVLTEARDSLADAALRERVERLIARHLPRNAEAPAAAAVPEREPDVVPPPPPKAARLDRPVADTPEDVAAELRVWWRRHQDDGPFEDALLDRLVRHAHRDHGQLAAALREGVADLLDWFSQAGHEPWNLLGVAAAVCGVPYPGTGSAFDTMVEIRGRELVDRLRNGVTTPFLLATATHDDGTIDPAELVARIAEYERLGAEPGPVDLAQALLRAVPEGGADARAAAGSLASPAGRRLADRLRTGGGSADPAAYPEPFATLLAGPGPTEGRSPVHGRSVFPCRPEDLPCDPDVQADWAWYLTRRSGARMDCRTLERLAALPGHKGEAMHRALAEGLNEDRREDRAAAVDAVVVMVSRGELDPAGLAAALGELTVPMASRLASALGDASAAVGARAVWPVVSGLLPRLLPSGAGLRGLSDLLALATDLAPRAGAEGGIPGLAEVASRPPKSRLVKEARRLHGVLPG